MFNTIKLALEEWNTNTDSRRKLQHTYIVVSIALLLTAGIVGLINYTLGQKILFIAILAVAMFAINAVAWALLQSFVLLKLGANEISTKAIKKSKIAANKKPSNKK